MAEKEIAPAPAEKALDEVSIEAHGIEQGIPRAKLNHLASVHKLDLSAKVSADKFADLLVATSKARV